MVGRQVITTNRAFTLEELKSFMDQYWNKQEFNEAVIGRPTKASLGEYILLPATDRFLVIIYPKAAGGLFNKENKIVLSVAENPAGAREAFFSYVPVNNAIAKIAQTGQVLSAEKERTGPAEQVLQMYTAHMKQILANTGLLK